MKEAQEVTHVSKHDPPRKVVLFSTNERYASAVASSVVSVRVDGGYKGDIAVILDESSNVTIAWLKDEIRKEEKKLDERQQQLVYFNNSDEKLFFYSTKELLDSVLDNPQIAYMKDPPPSATCLDEKQARSHRSHYYKTLMFHPTIAEKWDIVLCKFLLSRFGNLGNWLYAQYFPFDCCLQTLLLYTTPDMDACMTISSPHIHEIFEMSEISGYALAFPDPWRWGRGMMAGRVLTCANSSLVNNLTQYIGKPLSQAAYFTSGFIVYDSDIVREYDRNSEEPSLVELMKLYHTYSTMFIGDQLIISVYWYHVRHRMRNLPLTMIGTDRVPYEFVPRLKNDPHIVTAGHTSRQVCAERPTNKFAWK